MLQIHAKARTTPAVRAEIAASREPTGVLAKRHGISTETVRKWRKRGPGDGLDHSTRPKTLPWNATEDERAIVCAVRQATRFPRDDLTFAVQHFLPHLNRDSLYRILKSEGLHRLADLPPLHPGERPRKGQGQFKSSDLGFIHIDIKHLPKLRTRDGECRKRYLFVAIDRRSRRVHLAVKDDETEKSALAFLDEAVAAFPFQLTHVRPDRGSCFTAVFSRRCRQLGTQHRMTKPSPPQTNGMVERFNGRIKREGLTILVGSHTDLERLLRGYSQTYNARRQRVLTGLSPDETVRRRLKTKSELTNPRYIPPDPKLIPAAMRVVASAKELMQPDIFDA
jgi:transposase InsO family protein/transposase-like protein